MPELAKIWIMVDKDHQFESFRPVARATIEESHAHKIRVAVHATELETARAAVEEGADVLVHSVIDKPVDDAFVKLLKDRHTILCPTLVVFERYGRTFANRLNLTPEERAWGNPEVIASLDVTKIPSDKLPERLVRPRQRSEEHTSELQSRRDLVCRLLHEKKKEGEKYHPREPLIGRKQYGLHQPDVHVRSSRIPFQTELVRHQLVGIPGRWLLGNADRRQ